MPKAQLYIVEESRFSTGDVCGSLVCENGDFIYNHFSSSLEWLIMDLTMNFGRQEDLAERFPDGYEATTIRFEDDLPESLKRAWK